MCRKELSVIIVNWNTKNMLKNCLDSLRKNTRYRTIKTIVVDNASSDGSREMVRTLFPEVKLVNSGGNIGFGRANNLGLKYADTPFILFLNPDTEIVANAVEDMLEFMKANPSIGALGCKLCYPDGRVQTTNLQWFPSPWTELVTAFFLNDWTISRFRRFLPYIDPCKSGYASKIYGAVVLTRSEVVKKVGGFDPRFFMYCEDVDLSRRIMDAGWRLYYLSEATVIHHVAGASSHADSNFSTLMMCDSISRLMEKYYGKKGLLLYKLIVFLGATFRVFILSVLSIMPLKVSWRNRISRSIGKNISKMQWSLNLQKPKIKI